jgi:sulfoxide reductase heme-binding subunit YedZ
MPSEPLLRWVAKPLVFLLALIPLGLLVADGLTGGLGANPVETVTHRTGDWALRFLLLTLALTPLRRLTRWRAALRFRRLLGLFAFFYTTLHLLAWAWVAQRFRWDAMLEDVIGRPYVTAGMAAFLLMLPLALTSTRGMMRRLGRRWQALHRLIYGAAALGVLHFLWLTKADFLEPGIYAALLLLLLALRVPLPAASSRPAPAASAGGREDAAAPR